MKDISKQTVEKIKQQQVRLISKKVFVLKSFLWWVAFALAGILGALSLAIAFFLIRDLDWDVYGHAGHSLIEFALISIPHLWIVFILVFLLISYGNLRHTEKGYRYRSFSIMGAVLAISILFGFGFTALGFGEKLNSVFMRKIPGYGEIVQTKERQWSQPEKGLIGGKITQLRGEDFVLEDFEGEKWNVDVDETSNIKGPVRLEESEKVKIIGKKISDNEFEAKEIRPWEGSGRGKMQNENGSRNQKRGMRIHRE